MENVIIRDIIYTICAYTRGEVVGSIEEGIFSFHEAITEWVPEEDWYVETVVGYMPTAFVTVVYTDAGLWEVFGNPYGYWKGYFDLRNALNALEVTA